MKEIDLKTYEEIRTIASRNWLKPASVSLAKLEEVKTRVYNLGLTDAKNLKPAGQHDGHSKNHQNLGSSEPPLSKLASQRNAWGSNTSIPDLIRQQSEKVRYRPSSATRPASTRPSSGRRQRPQSAKELPPSGMTQARKPHDTTGIGVQGTRQDPCARPPSGSNCHVASVGWVAPPGGLCNLTNKEVDDIIFTVAEEQLYLDDPNTGEYAGVEAREECNSVPSVPRSSPDIEHMLQSEVLLECEEDVAMETQGVKHKTPSSTKNTVLLRRPTPEPIHFSLPTAEEDYAEEADQFFSDGDLESSFKEDAEEGANVSEDGNPRCDTDLDGQQYMEGLLDDSFSKEHSDTENRIDDVRSSSLSQPTRPHRDKKSNVTFAEQFNVTVDITPRNKRCTPPRPGSGRVGRQAKGRVDSGHVRSASCDGRMRKDRGATSPSPTPVRLAPVSLAYLDDMENDQRKDNRDKTKPDIETMVSKMNVSGESAKNRLAEAEVEIAEAAGNDVDDSRPGSACKHVSGMSRNYYELARHAAPSRLRQVEPRDQTKQITKTVKTLELGDNREVQETKSVSVIDAHASPPCPADHRRPPRPMSAKKTTTDRETEKTKMTASKSEKNRPLSEKDNHPRTATPEKENHCRTATPGKKPRVVSAPVRRRSKTCDGVVPPKPSNRIRPVSAQMVGLHSRQASHGHSHSRQASHGHSHSRKTGNTTMIDTTQVSAETKRTQTTPQRKVVSAGKLPCRTVTSAKRKASKDEPKQAIYISTRRNNFPLEGLDTEGVEECRELHEKLRDRGLPVSLETLTRALLPPAQFAYHGETTSPLTQPSLPNSSDGLLSKPSVWLAAEYKNIRVARKRAAAATKQLMRQEMEDRRVLLAENKLKKKYNKTKRRNAELAGSLDQSESVT